MGFTALDIIVFMLVGGAAALGIVRGFVTEVLSLFSWVAAIFVLKIAHGPATALLTGIVGTAAGAAVLAFALLFLITFAAGKFLAAAIGRRTRQSILGPLDRLLGLGFGAVKGLLAATLIFLLATLVHETLNGAASPKPEWMRQSRTYPLLNASGRAVLDFVNRRRGKPAADEAGNAADNAGDNGGE